MFISKKKNKVKIFKKIKQIKDRISQIKISMGNSCNQNLLKVEHVCVWIRTVRKAINLRRFF